MFYFHSLQKMAYFNCIPSNHHFQIYDLKTIRLLSTHKPLYILI